MSNKYLTKKQFLTISVMLFGLFFGAGNLIFPPYMGYQAGEYTFYSFPFFTITAVIFPILGILAVAETKGLHNLGKRVHPIFAIIFTSLIYLAIGPGLGIPRAGSVPFEMTIVPYFANHPNIFVFRILYTLIFFSLAYFISLKPNKLVNRMGKFLTPSLILLIIFMFVGIILKNPHSINETPHFSYASNYAVTGFLKGYDTMDTVAALNFGLVISLAISSFSIKDEEKVFTYSIRAGVVAGVLLIIIYAMLAYIGMTTAGLVADAKNGAQILLASTYYVFGNMGTYLLISIFTLACLTTCVGLITSGSQYFTTLLKGRLSYKQWVFIWSFFSFIISNFGLDTILRFSIPVLLAIYPVSILLIILTLLAKYMRVERVSYRLVIIPATLISIINALDISGLHLGSLTTLTQLLPWYDRGLSWILPAVISFLIGILFDRRLRDNKLRL